LPERGVTISDLVQAYDDFYVDSFLDSVARPFEHSLSMQLNKMGQA
jgi:hypothetical protein